MSAFMGISVSVSLYECVYLNVCDYANKYVYMSVCVYVGFIW